MCAGLWWVLLAAEPVYAIDKAATEILETSTGRPATPDTALSTSALARAQAWGLSVAQDGRVRVRPTLQLPDHPNVYVIGDLAYLEEQGQSLPPLAPVAIQQGIAAARNVARQVAGQEPLPFRYRDPGIMATIGRNAAVAVVRGRALTGFIAWLLWLGVHLVKLIGFRNRLLVLINWAWDYFLFERAVRLILPLNTAALHRGDPDTP